MKVIWLYTYHDHEVFPWEHKGMQYNGAWLVLSYRHSTAPLVNALIISLAEYKGSCSSCMTRCHWACVNKFWILVQNPWNGNSQSVTNRTTYLETHSPNTDLFIQLHYLPYSSVWPTNYILAHTHSCFLKALCASGEGQGSSTLYTLTATYHRDLCLQQQPSLQTPPAVGSLILYCTVSWTLMSCKHHSLGLFLCYTDYY